MSCTNERSVVKSSPLTYIADSSAKLKALTIPVILFGDIRYLLSVPVCPSSALSALMYMGIMLHRWSWQDLQSPMLWTWTCGMSFHLLWNILTTGMTFAWCAALQFCFCLALHSFMRHQNTYRLLSSGAANFPCRFCFKDKGKTSVLG